MRKWLLFVVLMLLAMPVMAQDATEEAPPAEVARVRVGHFSPDAGAVDVYIDDQPALTGFEFPTVTDWFTVPVGSYEIGIAPAGEEIILTVPVTLTVNNWVTLAARGSVENDSLTLQVIPEDYSIIADGNARVTIYHVIEDAPSVDVAAGSDILVSVLAYPGTVGNNDGAFTVEVAADTYDLLVIETGTLGQVLTQPTPAPDATTFVIASLPGTELAANTHYFAAAVGTVTEPQVVIAVTDLGATDDIMSLDLSAPADMSEAGEAASVGGGAPTDLVTTAATDGRFTVLVSALEAAQLSDVVANFGPYTLFAPTDEAFAATLDELGITQEELLGDPGLLTNILLSHLVDGEFAAADVAAVSELPTQFATIITIEVTDDGVVLNESASVVEADIDATNGVIHVIDAVLLPAE